MPVSTTRSARTRDHDGDREAAASCTSGVRQKRGPQARGLAQPGIGGGQARSATAIYRAWPDRPGCGGMVAVDPPLWGGSAEHDPNPELIPRSRGPSGQSQSLRTSKAAWSVNPIRAAITSECSGSRQGGPDRNERARETCRAWTQRPPWLRGGRAPSRPPAHASRAFTSRRTTASGHASAPAPQTLHANDHHRAPTAAAHRTTS